MSSICVASFRALHRVVADMVMVRSSSRDPLALVGASHLC